MLTLLELGMKVKPLDEYGRGLLCSKPAHRWFYDEAQLEKLVKRIPTDSTPVGEPKDPDSRPAAFSTVWTVRDIGNSARVLDGSVSRRVIERMENYQVSARRRRAAVGSSVFFLAAPGVMVGLVPWLLTRRTRRRPVPGGTPVHVAGGVLIIGGAAVLAHSFVRFVVEGIGTPAPVAPTERLVVGGAYRHVRNPMYVAIGATILGQAILFGRPRLLLYGALGAIPVVTFVQRYEEPTLARTFGSEYEEYRRNVPAWLPRLRPWHGGGDPST